MTTDSPTAATPAALLRQRVLVLYLLNSALDSDVVGWSQYDGTGRTSPTTGDSLEPPYRTGLEALRDGWRLIQASQLLPPPGARVRRLLPQARVLLRADRGASDRAVNHSELAGAGAGSPRTVSSGGIQGIAWKGITRSREPSMDAENSRPSNPDAWPSPAPAPPTSPTPVTPPPVVPLAKAAATQDRLGLAMKRRGPVAVWLGLPLITFGIYHLVWYFKIHKELRQYDQEQQNLSPLGSMLVLLLLGWTIVAPLISYYNTGEAIAKAQRRAGVPATCSPIAGMLLYFVFGLNVWYMQKQLNLIIEAYPGARPDEEVPLPASDWTGLAAG